jgi:hypothetical protein
MAWLAIRHREEDTGHDMNRRFSWKIGQLPDNAASIVWVRDDQGPYWSRLPDGASQAEIEKGFVESYDFGKRREPINCKATIMKDGKKTDQCQFTIHPPVKNISDIYVQYEASEPFKGARLRFCEFSRRYQEQKLRHIGEYTTTKRLATPILPGIYQSGQPYPASPNQGDQRTNARNDGSEGK